MVIYETSVLVPLIVHMPRGAHSGTKVDAPANLMDLAPTCMAALELPDLPAAFGTSLIPAIKGRKLKDRPFMLESVHKPQKGDEAPDRMFGIVDGRYKYILFADGSEALFDLDADPNELKNVAEREPGELAKRREALAAIREQHQQYNAAPGEWIEDMERTLKALGY